MSKPKAEPFSEEAKRCPHSMYAAMRHAAPAHLITTPQRSNAWLVVGYNEAVAALTDTKTSRVGHQKNGTAVGWGTTTGHVRDMVERHMLNSDPPEHTRLRRLASSAFTARQVSGMRQKMESVANRLVEQVVATGGGDLIADFAAPFAITVISDLVGLDPAWRKELFHWMDRCATPDPGERSQVGLALEKIHSSLCELIALKRATPANDLISYLIAARDERGQLNDAEIIATAFLILLTGYEAPVHLIGNGVLSLLRHPDQMAKVRHDHTLVTALVEETLRFEGPVETAPTLYATEEIGIGDVTIGAGQAILVSLAAANRDHRKFPNPEVFDVERDATGHLTFGLGIHHCLGAHYSRQFGKVAFGALFRGADEIRRDFHESDLRWRNGVIIRGLKSLPVKV